MLICTSNHCNDHAVSLATVQLLLWGIAITGLHADDVMTVAVRQSCTLCAIKPDML